MSSRPEHPREPTDTVTFTLLLHEPALRRPAGASGEPHEARGPRTSADPEGFKTEEALFPLLITFWFLVPLLPSSSPSF